MEVAPFGYKRRWHSWRVANGGTERFRGFGVGGRWYAEGGTECRVFNLSIP